MKSIHDLQQALQTHFGNNSFVDFIWFFAALTFWYILFRFLKQKILDKLETAAQSYGVTIGGVLRSGLVPLLYWGALYIALGHLKFSVKMTNLINQAWIIFCTIQVARIALAFGLGLFDKVWQRSHANDKSMLRQTLSKVIQVVVWVLTSIFILDNLGFNISAAVAGLGIGGVAIALATQNILGDLFNYFVIFFDKPFEVGDVVHVADMVGEIEHIGLKTTRLRSVSGEQIVIPNTNLASSRVKNYKRMEQRRAIFTLGISYENSDEKLERVVDIVRSLIQAQPETRFERGHFKDFGESALEYEFVYHVLNSNYTTYMDIQHKVNIGIRRCFASEQIEMAYPVRVYYIKSGD